MSVVGTRLPLQFSGCVVRNLACSRAPFHVRVFRSPDTGSSLDQRYRETGTECIVKLGNRTAASGGGLTVTSYEPLWSDLYSINNSPKCSTNA